MNLKLLRVSELGEYDRKQLDAFLEGADNNGEFINSPRYLSYHAPGKFKDDSVVIYDSGCGGIRGVLMAAEDAHDCSKVISHPGTTFAGPIISQKRSVQDRQMILDMLLDYYEKKYKQIELRTSPAAYSKQPDELIEYLLVRKGYQRGIASLSNVINLKEIKRNDILMLYKAKRRNQVKKSLKDDLYEMKSDQGMDFSAWTSLTGNLEAKFHLCPTHSWDEIVHLRRLFPLKIHSYSLYRKTGEYGAFALVYCYKNIFHTQYLDMNYKLSAEYPNLFLIHQLIQTALKNNFSYFSFGASTEPGGLDINHGLFTYKAEFGGGEIILPKFIKTID